MCAFLTLSEKQPQSQTQFQFLVGCRLGLYLTACNELRNFLFWLQALLQDIPGRRAREKEPVGGEGDLTKLYVSICCG